MHHAIRLFVFDIAGTTVRDNGFVARAFRTAAHAAGLRPDDEWIRARMGIDKREVFREMLRDAGRPEDAAPGLLDRFETSIDDDLDRDPPQPLPGAADSIRELARAGVSIAFTTGFSARTAQSVIRRTPWERYPVVASDAVPRGRPAPDMILECMRRARVPDPREVGVAGDTPADLLAANAAGARIIIGVGHGSHTLDELRPHPHSHLLPDLRTLPEIVRGAL
jgi:phosphonatase-like hydrolase